jgi:PAS domain S-box-containing protein
LDLNLPDSNGLATIATVHQAHPWAAVVVITGEGSQEIGLQAIAQGAQDYLVKGQFNQQVLEKVIRYACERKRQQELIRQERDFAERLIQTAQVIVLVLDREGKIVRFNRHLELITGYNLQELQGRDWFELFVPAAMRQERRLLFAQAMKGDHSDQEVFPIMTKDGRQRVIQWSATLLSDQSGQPMALLCTGQDVTEQLAAQQAIRKANEDLLRANKELRSMQVQIVQSEKLASIGQLAAGMAHEMNTPLGFVASNFQTLQTYMNKLLELLDLYEQLTVAVEQGQRERRIELAEKIRQRRSQMRIDFLLNDIKDLSDESKEGLERIGQIVKSLRDFARIDQAEELGDYDINEGIRSTLAVAGRTIQQMADVRLELGDVRPISCRAGQVNQALYNIILNAAQAIASQERQDRGTITIRTGMADEKVICQISDNGPGIKSEHISKIYDPFFTTKPIGQGMGLGLTTAYDIIVNKHHGKIDVDSAEGKGTTFTVELPIQQADPLETAVPAGGMYVECTSQTELYTCDLKEGHKLAILGSHKGLPEGQGHHDHQRPDYRPSGKPRGSGPGYGQAQGLVHRGGKGRPGGRYPDQ